MSKRTRERKKEKEKKGYKNYIFLIFLIILFFSSYLLYFSTKSSDLKIVEAEINTPTPSPTPHTDFREISRFDASKKQVVLTIDAGEGERSAEGILTALSKHNAKATFFLVGKWLEKHPDLTKRIINEGHEVFNHSYSHPDFTLITPEEVKEELKKMDKVLYETASIHSRPYFRAPFGYRNEAVKQAAKEVGFQHIYWSVDAIDWREGETGESIKNRVLRYIHPGAIVLLHIGDIPTGEIMDDLIIEIKKRGYEIVPLSEGLEG